jgi:SAM-dependent methyltransferase
MKPTASHDDAISREQALRYRDEKAVRQDLSLGRWPRNRYEAAGWFAPGGDAVLDVGCGNGHVLYNLRHRYRRLAGVEISPVRAAHAREMLRGLEAEILVHTAEALPFPDESFGTVVSTDVIEHIVDAVTAARELHRVLAPGGCLVVTTPNVCSLRRRLVMLAGKFPWTSEGPCTEDGRLLDGGHFHYFTYGTVESICRDVGFVRCERFGIGRLGRLHQVYPPLLSSTVVLRCWRA